jgi:hypothetical protein
LEGYAIAATKNQVFEAILIMMLRSLQAISRAFFMINLPSRVTQLFFPRFIGQTPEKSEPKLSSKLSLYHLFGIATTLLRFLFVPHEDLLSRFFYLAHRRFQLDLPFSQLN